MLYPVLCPSFTSSEQLAGDFRAELLSDFVFSVVVSRYNGQRFLGNFLQKNNYSCSALAIIPASCDLHVSAQHQQRILLCSFCVDGRGVALESPS